MNLSRWNCMVAFVDNLFFYVNLFNDVWIIKWLCQTQILSYQENNSTSDILYSNHPKSIQWWHDKTIFNHIFEKIRIYFYQEENFRIYLCLPNWKASVSFYRWADELFLSRDLNVFVPNLVRRIPFQTLSSWAISDIMIYQLKVSLQILDSTSE